MEEAIMYKIDKNGNTVKIAVYDKFEEMLASGENNHHASIRKHQ